MRIRTLLSKARGLARRPGGPHIVPTTPPLGYNRLCHLEDFAHPALRGVQN